MKTGYKILILIGAIIAVIVALFVGSRVWLNYAWFENLGYTILYTKALWTKIWLWFSFFFIFLLFSGLNVYAAFKKGRIQSIKFQQAGGPVEVSRKVGVIVSAIGLLILALIMAGNASSRWNLVLRFFNQADFQIADPIYNRDVSFYVFSLPVYNFLKGWSLAAVILTMIAVSFLYLISGNVTYEYNKLTVTDQAKRHLFTLLILLALIIAWNYWLNIYQLLYSTRGAVFGAGFTDLKLVRPAYYIMIGVTLFTAFLTYMGIKKKSFKQPLIGYGILIGGAIVITGIIPGIFQGISVQPTELQKELPYLKHNINFTRTGFNLHKVESKPFPVRDSLTASTFAPEKGVAPNIRLWDHRPLKATFSQIQEFRLYYTFNDVDVDRYYFNDFYRQVMLSAREMDYDNLPPEAKTWVNRALQYTHGYGFVMTPVNEIGPEGLPVLFVKDIPPKTDVPLEINRPEIYYGETRTPYVIANTKLAEFDYPKGDQNVFTHYQGTGGIPVKNSFRKFLFAVRMRSLEIIFSQYITPQSRLMIHRSIRERVPKLAPFLRYDPNPYLVVSEGKLYWILDAYTMTNQFPYSERQQLGRYQGRFNYIRNSVKIVMDAYTGDVDFYIMDPEDALINTYSNIYPGVFKEFSQMPEDLQRHIRYPIFLFDVQTDMYQSYHMVDPQVFYNKEDKWTKPNEIYGDSQTEMIPYYTIVQFPDENGREEFVLILPFTPVNKNNMLAWVAAMCDPENYGKLIEYQFPKEKLVYGPLQIESRIDQNSEISQLFTLWGQRGSEIIRGNLLVIPVKDSLIYVEPVYLRAEQSEIPEMRRVIVGYQDRIEIGLDLRSALAKIFGEIEKPEKEDRVEKERAKPEAAAAIPEAVKISELIQQASTFYENAQNALKQGDFTAYGTQIKRLEDVLNQLKSQMQIDQEGE